MCVCVYIYTYIYMVNSKIKEYENMKSNLEDLFIYISIICDRLMFRFLNHLQGQDIK